MKLAPNILAWALEWKHKLRRGLLLYKPVKDLFAVPTHDTWFGKYMFEGFANIFDTVRRPRQIWVHSDRHHFSCLETLGINGLKLVKRSLEKNFRRLILDRH